MHVYALHVSLCNVVPVSLRFSCVSSDLLSPFAVSSLRKRQPRLLFSFSSTFVSLFLFFGYLNLFLFVLMSLPFFPFCKPFFRFLFFSSLLCVVYVMCESLCIVLHCFFFSRLFPCLLWSVCAFFLLLVTICLRFILHSVCLRQYVCVFQCVCVCRSLVHFAF